MYDIIHQVNRQKPTFSTKWQKCRKLSNLVQLLTFNLSAKYLPENPKQKDGTMPVKGGRTTRKEQTFVRAMALTGDKGMSALVAGYAAPETNGHHVANRPGVQAAIAAEQTRLLFETALPLAVQTLVSIMADSRAPAGARVQAVKVALDRTLGSQEGAQAKQPHEMSPDELAQAIANLEQMAMAKAKPVEAEVLPDILA